MRIAVRVHPRASQARVSWDGTTLGVWVTAPAVEGAANRAVVEAVASWAGVRTSAVRLVGGEHSRTKVVEVEGLTCLPDARPRGSA